MAARRKKTQKKKEQALNIPKVVVETKVTKGDKTSVTKKTVGPFKLVNRSGSDYDDGQSWVIKAKVGRGFEGVGEIYVTSMFTSDGKLTAAITEASIDEEFQGLGLAKAAYQYLANQYNGLESDPSGCTSAAAQRVWKALKAKKLPRKRFRIEAEKKK